MPRLKDESQRKRNRRFANLTPREIRGMIKDYQGGVELQDIVTKWRLGDVSTLYSCLRKHKIPNRQQNRSRLHINQELNREFKKECRIIGETPKDVITWLIKSWIYCQREDRGDAP